MTNHPESPPPGGQFHPQPTQGQSYEVAISYANEDIEIADAIANRLRQDGYRCFYNPNRLHQLLGLVLGEELLNIYGHPATQVVALISMAYLSKEYPMKEFNAAAYNDPGPDRIIPVRIGNAPMPAVLGNRSYASHSKYGSTVTAIHISRTLSERIGKPRELTMPHEDYGFAADTVMPLDHPRRPYSLQDVDFHDTDEKYLVDISTDECEFDDPRDYINRGLDELKPENAFFRVSRDDIRAAKKDVRTHIAERKAVGWPVFNGKKFGVANILRGRSPEYEDHRMTVNVYETDYFTSLFAKKLYGRLNLDNVIRIHPGQTFSQYSGMLASFGFDIMLLLPHMNMPHILVVKRSMNVSEAAENGGLWHVSMNEGLSRSDRYAKEFDSSSTFFRGFHEELNIRQSEIARAELLEPFIQYSNFEIGIAGIAYTALDFEYLLRRADFAADRLLETDQISAFPATVNEIRRFLAEERDNMTDTLALCLQSILMREITATV